MSELKRDNFYIITGAPGVGKSTLISELTKKFTTISEPAREVISEQRKIGGSGIWEKDRDLFIDLLLEKSIAKYEHCNPNTLTFFDRGIPDNIAYASYGNLNTDRFNLASDKLRYNQKVFFLPPWEEIYTTDEERNMNFNEVLKFHEHILKAYKGYNLVEVPKVDLLQRVKFIEKNIV